MDRFELVFKLPKLCAKPTDGDVSLLLEIAQAMCWFFPRLDVCRRALGMAIYPFGCAFPCSYHGSV